MAMRRYRLCRNIVTTIVTAIDSAIYPPAPGTSAAPGQSVLVTSNRR